MIRRCCDVICWNRMYLHRPITCCHSLLAYNQSAVGLSLLQLLFTVACTEKEKNDSIHTQMEGYT